jgi:hypothetical protein
MITRLYCHTTGDCLRAYPELEAFSTEQMASCPLAKVSSFAPRRHIYTCNMCNEHFYFSVDHAIFNSIADHTRQDRLLYLSQYPDYPDSDL